jgi:hypothetical protein
VIGHELAHVVQQRMGRVTNPFGSGVAIVRDQMLEAEAERMALEAARPIAASPPSPAQRLVSPRTVQPLWPFDAIYDYFYPPTPPVPPPPTPQELHRRALSSNRNKFRSTGSAGTLIDPSLYTTGIDDRLWSRLTHLHGKASNRKRYKEATLVSLLFDNFCNAGIGYHIGYAGVTTLLSSTPEASCVGMAKGFADLLNAFGIEAEAEFVREEAQDNSRFIVHVPNFIDSNVQGHIYKKGVLVPDYYMFSSHAATWVPSSQRYFDPMAKSVYATFDPLIDCELSADKNDQVFIPKKPPKTFQTGWKWKLIRRNQTLQGGFNRLDMVPLKKGK